MTSIARVLLGFAMISTSFLSGSFQHVGAESAGDADTTSKPNLQEPAPSSEPASETPALQLELDSAGVEVVPSPLRTVDGYTLEEMDVRVRRAKIGIGSSALAFFVGGILMASGLGGDCGWGGGAQRESCDRLAYAGTALAAGGAVGMIATGILLGVRKGKRRGLQEADYGRAHRVQWDLARSHSCSDNRGGGLCVSYSDFCVSAR
jgi:hypothetical protein